jgi:Bifunctional DNA primase/polymerase, N-terminal
MISAIKLAQRGLPVFPCNAASKAPLIATGFKAATTDTAVITKWWSTWPEALIGVPTGVRFVVLDLDLQHEDARRWYDQNRDRLPRTRTHTTRSGGLHLLFAPNDKVTCSTSRVGPHIDTRGRGGYVCWWPGAGLEVVHPGELAAVPDWIMEALHPAITVTARRQVRAPARDRLAGVVRTIAQAREGERNAITFWGACRLAEMAAENAISSSEAIEIVIEAASRAGLPHNEARRTAHSAFQTVGI